LNKFLVYSAVFGGYDRIYPPVVREKNVDYLIITDRAGSVLSGWDTVVVESEKFATAKAANLFYRALIHRSFPKYDASLYIDGNVRLLKPTEDLFQCLLRSGAPMMLYHHSTRRTVVEELEVVLKNHRVVNPQRAINEVDRYFREGFPDNQGLGETTILLKNHRHHLLDEAMHLWWNTFSENLTRDQLSLPYVLWKTGMQVAWLPGSVRKDNPYFGLYPHFGGGKHSSLYCNLCARSYDSPSHRYALHALHGTLLFKDRVSRACRRLMRAVF
jgi:hypothetical protein